MQDKSRQSLWTWMGISGVVLFCVLFTIVVLGILTSGLFPLHDGYSERPKLECMNNLRHIGAILVTRRSRGEDIHSEVGARFLLQVFSEFEDQDLKVFLCPGDAGSADLQPSDLAAVFRKDWREAPCSYRGPDEELLARLRENPGARVIIACDLNGPDGRSPHHKAGAVCLWTSGKVTFMEWADFEGFDGGPVPVGPDSPDPRFRHLVP